MNRVEILRLLSEGYAQSPHHKDLEQTQKQKQRFQESLQKAVEEGKAPPLMLIMFGYAERDRKRRENVQTLNPNELAVGGES